MSAAEREHLQAELDGIGSKPPPPTMWVPAVVTPEAAAEVAVRFLRGEGAPPTVALSELRRTVVPVLWFDASYRVTYRGQRARRTSSRRVIGRDAQGNDVSFREASHEWESAAGTIHFQRRHPRLASSRPLPTVVLGAIERVPQKAWQRVAATRVSPFDDCSWVSSLDRIKAELADAALAEARSEACRAIGGEAQQLGELTCQFTLRSVVAAQATVYLASFQIGEVSHSIAVDGATGGVACSWTDTPRAQKHALRRDILAGICMCLMVSVFLLFECNPRGRAELAATALGPLCVWAAILLIWRLLR